MDFRLTFAAVFAEALGTMTKNNSRTCQPVTCAVDDEGASNHAFRQDDCSVHSRGHHRRTDRDHYRWESLVIHS